jgi:hypothetical protein
MCCLKVKLPPSLAFLAFPIFHPEWIQAWPNRGPPPMGSCLAPPASTWAEAPRRRLHRDSSEHRRQSQHGPAAPASRMNTSGCPPWRHLRIEVGLLQAWGAADLSAMEVESTSEPTTTLLANGPAAAAHGGAASTAGRRQQTTLKADAAGSASGARRGLDLLALLRRLLLLLQLVSTFESRLDSSRREGATGLSTMEVKSRSSGVESIPGRRSWSTRPRRRCVEPQPPRHTWGWAEATSKAYASLHNQKRKWVVFPTMQLLPPLLHRLSLAKTICRLPITGKVHYTSLDRGCAAYRSHPK